MEEGVQHKFESLRKERSSDYFVVREVQPQMLVENALRQTVSRPDPSQASFQRLTSYWLERDRLYYSWSRVGKHKTILEGTSIVELAQCTLRTELVAGWTPKALLRPAVAYIWGEKFYFDEDEWRNSQVEVAFVIYFPAKKAFDDVEAGIAFSERVKRYIDEARIRTEANKTQHHKSDRAGGSEA